MNEQNQRIVKETVINLLEAMGVEASIEEERIENINNEEMYTISLNTSYPNLLIGKYGTSLQSFQHLIGVIIRKKILKKEKDNEKEISKEDCKCVDNNKNSANNKCENLKFNIDFNNYKKQRKKSLERLVDSTAVQVIHNKSSIVLGPMSAYERKVIHTEVSTRKNLSTESVGEGYMKRVIIKYVDIVEMNEE